MTKTCSKCQQSKPVTEFYEVIRHGKRKPRPQCKTCYNTESRARWKRHPAKDAYLITRRNYHLMTKYGLTPEQYQAMSDAQDGRCFLCGRTPEQAGGRKGRLGAQLNVDHSHNCCPGERTCGNCIRKLLCGRCNRMVALVELVGVEALSAYLA